MEPLKEMFNAIFLNELAFYLKQNYPSFEKDKFLKTFNDSSFYELSLNQRMRKITETMCLFLPDHFKQSIAVLKKTIPQIKSGYTTIIFPDYIALFGKNNFSESLQALKFFTQFGTSEFAIREFLKLDFDSTFHEMKKWASDKNVHVRRLSSEGSRPRLPWSFKLDKVINNPLITRDVLMALKNDNELYVKKSVANHLNDITKDNPDAYFKIIKDWNLSNPNTNWIIKHSARTLIKKGDNKALSILGYNNEIELSEMKLKLKDNKIILGEKLEFEIIFDSLKEQNLIVDYAIYYLKKNGNYFKKVFKLKRVSGLMNQKTSIHKSQQIKDFSTRKHNEGKHYIEIIINGKNFLKTEFNLFKKN